MTITTTTLRAQYNGNGVTTSFAVPFEFLEGSTLKVILTSAAGVDTTQTITTHYTVTGGGAVQPDDGSVVMVTAPATGEKLTILRAQPLTQAASYTEQGPFPAKAHEKALDRIDMQVQMLAERLARAPLYKETSTNSGAIFPEPEADKVIGWNADGDELENKALIDFGNVYEVVDEDDMASNSDTKVPTQQSVKAYTDAQIATRQPLDTDLTSWAGVTRASGFDTFAATPSSANLRSLMTDETGTGSLVFGTDPVISVTATGASAARALASRFAFILQAEDFGCVGDDSTDNTSAITAAVAAFSSVGGVLQFGKGIYRLTAVTVNKPIIFQGQGHEATMLKSTTLTGDVLTMTSPGACAKDIRFDATGNRTSGAYLACSSVYQTHFERLYFTKYYRGITFDNCISCSISRSDFRDGTPNATSADSAGIVFLGTQSVDNRIDCVTMDAADGSQPGHGIWLLNSDACQIVNTDIIHHGYALDMTPGNSQSVAATYVANSYFDNSNYGIRMLTSGTGTIPRATFVGVWSSSHDTSGAEITASGGAITAISFIGCQMLLNTSRGMLINGGTGIRIIGGHYNSNTVDGIAFGSGVSEFCVQGVQAISNGAQGIYIVGSNDNYQIIGNDLRSNSGEALLGHEGNTSTKITHSNLGIPEVALTRQIVTVQGSDVSLTNNITTAQSVFASANDAITLLASTTYRFRARLMIATGTTTHTTAFGFGGTATFTNIHYRSLLWSGTSGTINTSAPSKLDVGAATATVLNATSGAAFTEIEIEGVMRINGAGTVIPQITFSAGPTGTCAVKVNSFIEFEPIGSNTVAAVARAA